jgi:hypothetical protein
MCGLGLVVSVLQLLEMVRQVGDRIAVFDWIIIVLLLASPPCVLWRYFGRVRDLSDEVVATGMQIAMGGYVPRIRR